MDEGGQEGAERARERVRAALDAAVGVEQPRGVQAGAVRALGESFERVAVHDHVWVQQDGDRLAHPLQRQVVGRAEARVVAAFDEFGAVVARQLRAAVVGAGVDHDQLVGMQGGEQLRQLGAGAVQDDDRGEAHGRCASRRATESRTSKACSARRRAAAGASGSSSACLQRLRGLLGVTGRIQAAGAVLDDLARAGAVGRDDRPAGRQRLHEHQAVRLGVGAVQQDVVLGERLGDIVDWAFERDAVGWLELWAGLAGERRAGDRDLQLGQVL